MGGASTWYAILAITGFLASVWIAGRASRQIGVSSIVLEVAIGLILGPSVIGLIPSELSECYADQTTRCTQRADQESIARKGTEFCDLAAYVAANKYAPGLAWNQGFWGPVKSVILDSRLYCLDPNDASCTSRRLSDDKEGYHEQSGIPMRRLSDDKQGKTDYDTYPQCLQQSCELDLALKCASVPDIFTLVGHTGVAMMIFESGLHFDFEQAKTVGPWACVVAVLGTLLPLAGGCALAMAYGFDFFPDAMSCGTSLAPTSVGIALKLLHEAKALQKYFGQAVMTAAFVDDVLSLILFSVLMQLGGDKIEFMTFLPLILGCVFMVVAVVAAVLVWPSFIDWMFRKIPNTNKKISRHDEVFFLLMLVTLVAYAQITHVCGTHLWGCFIAGMCFSTQHHAHHVWVRQVKRMSCWFLRIFFACTLAWSIPVEELFSLEAFWKGSLMGIGPCILTKVCCGPFMGDARWVIGWAMVGRAEFAYFIAIYAKAVKMMDEKLFAILIWALIYATIFAPLMFRKVLSRYMAKLASTEDPDVNWAIDQNDEDDEDYENSLRTCSKASGHLPVIKRLTKEERAKLEASGQAWGKLSKEEKAQLAMGGKGPDQKLAQDDTLRGAGGGEPMGTIEEIESPKSPSKKPPVSPDSPAGEPAQLLGSAEAEKMLLEKTLLGKDAIEEKGAEHPFGSRDGGEEALADVKEAAAELLEDKKSRSLEKLGDDAIQKNSGDLGKDEAR